MPVDVHFVATATRGRPRPTRARPHRDRRRRVDHLPAILTSSGAPWFPARSLLPWSRSASKGPRSCGKAPTMLYKPTRRRRQRRGPKHISFVSLAFPLARRAVRCKRLRGCRPWRPSTHGRCSALASVTAKCFWPATATRRVAGGSLMSIPVRQPVSLTFRRSSRAGTSHVGARDWHQ
jgi:hypothetical protein